MLKIILQLVLLLILFVLECNSSDNQIEYFLKTETERQTKHSIDIENLNFIYNYDFYKKDDKIHFVKSKISYFTVFDQNQAMYIAEINGNSDSISMNKSTHKVINIVKKTKGIRYKDYRYLSSDKICNKILESTSDSVISNIVFYDCNLLNKKLETKEVVGNEALILDALNKGIINEKSKIFTVNGIEGHVLLFKKRSSLKIYDPKKFLPSYIGNDFDEFLNYLSECSDDE